MNPVEMPIEKCVVVVLKEADSAVGGGESSMGERVFIVRIGGDYEMEKSGEMNK